MARPRTPTAVLELKGAFRKNPARGRARAGEPKVDRPLGSPPDSLSVEVHAAWCELEEMTPDGVLTYADRWLVEMAARLMDLVRRGLAETKDYSALMRCLASMGLTPVDRSKINLAPPDEEQDELSALAAELTGGAV